MQQGQDKKKKKRPPQGGGASIEEVDVTEQIPETGEVLSEVDNALRDAMAFLKELNYCGC